jgi:uncharacterized membrane protein YfhO
VIEHYAPHRVVISAASDHPGYLVLTDTWFPGWTAHVDGRETPVERADYAFRAVRLESGRHEIEFRYDPGSVRLGPCPQRARAARDCRARLVAAAAPESS